MFRAFVLRDFIGIKSLQWFNSRLVIGPQRRHSMTYTCQALESSEQWRETDSVWTAALEVCDGYLAYWARRPAIVFFEAPKRNYRPLFNDEGGWDDVDGMCTLLTFMC